VNQSVHDIDALTYVENGNDVPIPRGIATRMKITISMFNDMSRQLGGNVDLNTVTLDDCNAYRMEFYEAAFPLGRRRIAGPNPVAPAAVAQAPVRPGMLPYELFDRGIKKDKADYKEFKDEKAYDQFRRNVECVAHTHGTSEVLDGDYVPDPNDANEVRLFRSQQNFMYTVFEKILQTDKSASLVRRHEATRDAQTIWKELKEHQLSSTSGALHKERLLQHLTGHKLSSLTWKGTFLSYITHWQDQMREYEALVPTASRFDDDMKRTLLQTALSSIPALDNVKAHTDTKGDADGAPTESR
jgi:hypothetical protein